MKIQITIFKKDFPIDKEKFVIDEIIRRENPFRKNGEFFAYIQEAIKNAIESGKVVQMEKI